MVLVSQLASDPPCEGVLCGFDSRLTPQFISPSSSAWSERVIWDHEAELFTQVRILSRRPNLKDRELVW